MKIAHCNEGPDLLTSPIEIKSKVPHASILLTGWLRRPWTSIRQCLPFSLEGGSEIISFYLHSRGIIYGLR